MVGQQMCLAIDDCSASIPWLKQAEEDILYLYWEGTIFFNVIKYFSMWKSLHAVAGKVLRQKLVKLPRSSFYRSFYMKQTPKKKFAVDYKYFEHIPGNGVFDLNENFANFLFQLLKHILFCNQILFSTFKNKFVPNNFSLDKEALMLIFGYS